MKQITKTSDIIAKLQKAVGPDVNTEDLIVYEATAFNTLPLRKRHPLYNKAVASEGILHEMAQQVAGESIPLHVMHSADGLNIGRVFAGSVVSVNGAPELRVLFFLPKSAAQAAELIDTGTVDQVSVSFLSDKLLCSDCGFDFFGPDATIDHIYGGICSEGHVLGEGNTHAKMVGLDRWFELSLVNTGGAQKARIHSGRTSVFASDHRLAASGKDPNFMIANLSTQELGVVRQMDISEFIEKLTEKASKLALSEKTVEELQAKLAAAEAKIEELEAKVVATPADATQLQAATAFLKEQATAVARLTGAAFEAAEADVTKIVSFLNEGRDKLRIAIPLGGISQPASGSESEDKKITGNAGAFRSKKG